MKYHPDRADGDKTVAETKFKESLKLYEVLSDPDKRRNTISRPRRHGRPSHFSTMDVADIFSMFDDIFGGDLAAGAVGAVAAGRPAAARIRFGDQSS